MFRNYDLILCPGDSPSKYIEAVEDAGIKLKRTQIVSFPISGLGSEKELSLEEKKLLKNYLLKVLDEYLEDEDIHPNKIAIFDTVSSGNTYWILTEILCVAVSHRLTQIIYGINLEIPIIETPYVGTQIDEATDLPIVTNELFAGPYDILYDERKLSRELSAARKHNCVF